jgi:hypothetical protein
MQAENIGGGSASLAEANNRVKSTQRKSIFQSLRTFLFLAIKVLMQL